MQAKRIALAGLAALGLSGVFAAQQVANSSAAQETRATSEERKTRKAQQPANKGYAPSMASGHESVPPKLYGMRYGRGNRKKKTNFLHLAHKAKVKKRNSK